MSAIDPRDLRFDTYSQGPTGKHFVRVTHVPSGTTAAAVDAVQGRARAMAMDDLRRQLTERST